jgi:phosphatidylinositol alpha-1,6-mannosyltransferase
MSRDPAPTARTIVLTPNLTGRDGISRLARLVTGAVDRATVLALHEPSAVRRYRDVNMWGADGRSSRFVKCAVRQAASCGADTTVIVMHLHLVATAMAFAARGASIVTILCGIEAWRPLTWAQRTALDHVDTLLAISEFTRGRFRAANPRFNGRHIEVCRPGIDRIDQPVVDAGEPPSALIVGRMAADERYKGHDLLIEIWRDVVDAVPGAVLRVVGEGDDRPRLERVARSRGAGSHVVFLGGLDESALEREYERCTVFVMPSRDEGFGFVFVEAMRAARACVGSVGAASEIIADQQTGLLVDPDDRAQLLTAVIRMLRHPSAAAEMGRRGHARFLLEFTDARFRDRFSALIDRAAVSPGIPV